MTIEDGRRSSWTFLSTSKEQDAFHLTIKGIPTLALIAVEELPLTQSLGDYTHPMQIGNFVKELFAGFQLLNL
ncbi:uncharacterized protein N7500_007549 [Penicillium coprophilum]|uniref:uncharacterized protein n=1 Tax=Penicillium coprophilum TaxID=36646 RepID=UPI002398785B|nr:uncharacterized protein N7500_007549 [Penicillium coprophilum]KAJ5165719.1 hypothetical protein N7500_007549 [Penicillium coprophilum]